jgi:transposase
MRGTESKQDAMFFYAPLETLIAPDHPLRGVRELMDRSLVDLSAKFDEMYSAVGRPSVPPEQLLRATILQFLYGIRSERVLMDRLRYDLSFRWFVGLTLSDTVWDATVFTKNRERLLKAHMGEEFLNAIREQLQRAGWLSSEHFSVDGTLLEAWASDKSFQRKEEPPERGTGARGKQLLNDVFESKTDPEARKFKKSQYGDAKLCHLGHALMENRNGLVVKVSVTEARTGKEREAALEMLDAMHAGGKRITLGADKGYDDARFVKQLRALNVTPHIAQYQRRSSSLDRRTTRHAGYELSLERRARIENVFSWIKNQAGLRKVKLRGWARVGWLFEMAAAAYNLVRARKLKEQFA